MGAGQGAQRELSPEIHQHTRPIGRGTEESSTHVDTAAVQGQALVAAMLAAAFGGLGAAVAAALDWPAAPVAGAGGVCAIALLLASAVAALERRASA